MQPERDRLGDLTVPNCRSGLPVQEEREDQQRTENADKADRQVFEEPVRLLVERRIRAAVEHFRRATQRVARPTSEHA